MRVYVHIDMYTYEYVRRCVYIYIYRYIYIYIYMPLSLDHSLHRHLCRNAARSFHVKNCKLKLCSSVFEKPNAKL